MVKKWLAQVLKVNPPNIKGVNVETALLFLLSNHNKCN